MRKKKNNDALLKPWILANNPGADSACECFKFKMPSNKWVAVSRFENKSSCTQAIPFCQTLFKKNPIHYLRMMGMNNFRKGMGMMGMR